MGIRVLSNIISGSWIETRFCFQRSELSSSFARSVRMEGRLKHRLCLMVPARATMRAGRLLSKHLVTTKPLEENCDWGFWDYINTNWLDSTTVNVSLQASLSANQTAAARVLAINKKVDHIGPVPRSPLWLLALSCLLWKYYCGVIKRWLAKGQNTSLIWFLKCWDVSLHIQTLSVKLFCLLCDFYFTNILNKFISVSSFISFS